MDTQHYGDGTVTRFQKQFIADSRQITTHYRTSDGHTSPPQLADETIEPAAEMPHAEAV
ncbi:MAG: hypothetical protein JWM57_2933 [Phycisphaerales bacterium]|nr:hypothetical protein [Phycisphaerales bacterium]